MTDLLLAEFESAALAWMSVEAQQLHFIRVLARNLADRLVTVYIRLKK